MKRTALVALLVLAISTTTSAVGTTTRIVFAGAEASFCVKPRQTYQVPADAPEELAYVVALRERVADSALLPAVSRT